MYNLVVEVPNRMARTRFAWILYFRKVAYRLMPYPIKSFSLFFLIFEDNVQILLMLKAIFKQGSKIEDQLRGAFLSSEPKLLFSNNLFSLGFEPFQHDLQHDFSWLTMTDEASFSRAVGCPFWDV